MEKGQSLLGDFDWSDMQKYNLPQDRALTTIQRKISSK